MITWHCLSFAELSLTQLYDLLQLRQAVFIVEQNCPYLDADGKDASSYHLLGYDEAGLVAYCRLLPPFLAYQHLADASIGRVITHERVRSKGAGRAMMPLAITKTRLLFGENVAIRIGAQSYLLRFYSSFGFISTGKEYLEDGIPHTEMRLV